MKRKVQLYIAGRQVDLGDDSWILYNWTREEMANPTAVVNSSSHQIELPGTCRNNGVLGSAFRLDRRTVLGIRYDGTEFDPTRKTPFMLYADDGTVLESGYCRLDAVNTHNRRHAYALTLYGGLGSFFYALASKDDGTPRTLADLIWYDMDGEDVTDFSVTPGADTVQDAWTYLGGGTPERKRWWNVLNFAPCYNGLPSDFDASHALMDSAAWANIPAGVDEDDQRPYEWTYKAGLDCALVSFTNPHTEWELCDLRWYLQRPAVSVRTFIAAVCDPRNNGGYEVTLDPTFFNDANPYFADAWWTLGMIATEDRASSDCLNNVLRASKTPMRYLADFAKHFGLVFMWDGARHRVSIVTRATFYGTGEPVIDLSKRIDRSQQIAVDPVLADKRWYQLGDGGKGEFVEQYAKDYGKGYGTQRIDTGYEFDAGTTVLTDGMAFQDAAEVSETDYLFSEAARILSGRSWQRFFQLPRFEAVNIELWNDEGETKTFPVECPVDANYYDNPDHPFTDWLPKVQLHGDEDKGTDGADVLVFFSGVLDTPTYNSGSWDVRKSYFITEDSAAMQDLAGGPCWDLTRTGIQLTALPSFRRVVLSGRYIVNSWEWGAPAVRPVPDIQYPDGAPTALYDLWWKAYLSDRYATDTAVMTCRVDLRGLTPGQDLLRRFYWYDGALWVLNAIRNHPFTSWDLTECEFVRVQDKTAYTEGPGALSAHFLDITPSAASFQVKSRGEVLTLTVRSSSAWTLTQSAIQSWLVPSAVSGGAGTTVITLTAVGNDSSARRSVGITISNNDGISRQFNVIQPPKTAGAISLSPSSLTINSGGTGLRGASSRVTADGAWAVDETTVESWLRLAQSSAGITVYCDGNGGSARSSYIKVYLTGDPDTYAILAVTQEAGAGGSGGITLTDGQGNNSATVQATGGALTLVLTVPEGDDWTLTKSDNWVTVSPASGSGNNSQIAVTIPSYSGSSDRQATITANRDGYSEGAVFYIIQAAPAVQQDSITLTRRENSFYNNVEIGNGAEAEGFDVRSSGSWTVTTQASWIHPAYGSWSGSGNKTLWFTADANTGAARRGVITGVCGNETATFYVDQAGDGTVTLQAAFNKSSIDSTAQTVYLIIQATAGLAWSIDQATNCTPSQNSGTGPAEVAVTVGAASAQRTISLRVKNTVYGLYSTASCVQQAPAASDYLRVTPFGDVRVLASDTYRDFAVECSTSWKVTTTAQGVTISPGTGSGNGTVRVSFPANTSGSQVSIPLTFQTTAGTAITKTATIKQDPASSATLSVSPTTVNLPGNGTAASVGVSASGTWFLSKSDSWIVTEVQNSGQFRISAGVNNGAPRDGTVTVTCGDKSVTVSVHQATASALDVSSNAVTLGAADGSTGAVTVYASGLWDIWEYTDVPVWLRVSYPSHGGSENGEPITFTAVGTNNGSGPRSATIRIVLVDSPETYKDIVVTQESQPVLYVSPTAFGVGRGESLNYLHVTSNTDWHITEVSDGLNIAPASMEGSGNADVSVYVYPNPEETPRTMRVVFESLDGELTATASITQNAALPSIQVQPDEAVLLGAGITAVQRVVTCDGAWTAELEGDIGVVVEPDGGAADTPTTVVFYTRGSASEPQSGTWTITCGDKTKTISVRRVPEI